MVRCRVYAPGKQIELHSAGGYHSREESSFQIRERVNNDRWPRSLNLPDQGARLPPR